MAGDKRRQDAIHDHQVEYFASENGLTPDLAWELILKHGNSRKAVIKAAQGLKGDVRQHASDEPPTFPVEVRASGRERGRSNSHQGQTANKPATTGIVSVFEKPHWRTVLTTTDEQAAFDMAKEIGRKVKKR